MNPPFQSVGIVFLVTIAHVIVIAIYSSRSLPETSYQKPIIVSSVESVEMMPEQLIREARSTETNTDPSPGKDHFHSEGDHAHVEQDNSPSETKVIVKKERPKQVPEPVEKPLESEKPGVMAESAAKRWEDDAFAKRVSLPTLGGAIKKMPEKLVKNNSSNSAKVRNSGTTQDETAPRARTFSPVPRS